MNIEYNHLIQSLTNKLFKESLRLTNHNYDYACNLVQEVWCKILNRNDLGKDKLNEGYLIKVLRNHYYDQKKGVRSIDKCANEIEVADENETEAQLITKMEGDETEELLNAV